MSLAPARRTICLRKPQLRAAEASLAAAQADVAAAELALSGQRYAPLDGRLEKKSVDLGQFVAPGTVLAQVYATERLRCICRSVILSSHC